jgi:hypothetical protein
MGRWTAGTLILALGAGFALGRVSLPIGAGAAPALGRAAIPVAFVGSWETHGGLLDISTNGVGSDHLRTYINCTTTRQTACDRVVGNGIYPGQYDRFKITRVQGTTAVANVTDSAYSWRVGTRITITRGTNDTLTIHMPDGAFRYCGPKAPAGTCGA